MIRWSLLTGEYPPAPGGVADYTRRLAVALARAGDAVTVWAPSSAPLAEDEGIAVRALPDHFGPRSLALLSGRHGLGADERVLLQWVPNAFGMRAMNVPFCAWVAARRGTTWVMFHEVSYSFGRRVGWKQNVLALVTGAMAAALVTRAQRSFVSTPAWNDRLRRVAHVSVDATWLPIPSNLPEVVNPAAVGAAKAGLGLDATDVILGSFGTYGPNIAPHVADALVSLLARDPRRVGLLMGRGSAEFLERTLRPRLGSAARLIATGELETNALASHIASCTLVLQPYLDGITARRTSAMAGLALGVPLVTNVGPLTESIWSEEGAVALASSPGALAAEAESLLGDSTGLAALGAKGRDVYRHRFSLDRTIRILREPASA